jgi:hypothetical protein
MWPGGLYHLNRSYDVPTFSAMPQPPALPPNHSASTNCTTPYRSASTNCTTAVRQCLNQLHYRRTTVPQTTASLRTAVPQPTAPLRTAVPQPSALLPYNGP